MREDHDILYPSTVPFVLVHLAGLAAFWTGVSASALWLSVALYVLRMLAICAGYHRYFSHRAFSTSRIFQFVLALLAQSSGQKSVLWWAANHRHHHLHSDSERDIHSPRHSGFWYAHVGWIFSARNGKGDLSKVGDLARWPELVLLDRFERAPAIALALLTFAIAGWPGLIVGFFWSTIILYHATFCINSLAHMRGGRRYITGDESRNNPLLAIITLGEGWHNNHHAYPSSARQGFHWWEVDPTYYALIVLRGAGLVWDLKCPPASVIKNQRRLGARAIENAAENLARQFAHQADTHPLPVPTREELFQRAAAMFPASPSMDAIVDRTSRIISRRSAAA